jgi:predicted permease
MLAGGFVDRRSQNYAIYSGLLCGVSITALGIGNAWVQSVRHAIGPSAHSLVVFSYLFSLIAGVLLFAAGFTSTRKTGVLKCGQLAGAVAGAMPCLALAIGSNLSQLGSMTSKDPSALVASAAGYIIAALLIAGVGALFGAAIGTLGALVGRAGFREARLAQPYLDLLQNEALSAVTSPLDLEEPPQPGPPPASIASIPAG